MSCKSCKTKESKLSVFKNTDKKKREVEPTVKDFAFQLFSYSIRILLFAICLIASPLMLIFIVYMLFNTIILNNGEVNIMPSLLQIAKGLGIGKTKTEEEYPEDYEDLDYDNPDEYEVDERIDKISL